MSSIKDQNTAQFFPNHLDKEESSGNSFSEKDKKDLVDFFYLLLEWEIEDKKNKEATMNTDSQENNTNEQIYQKKELC